ncbi:hypothetical protein Acsp03_03120 [Actinomadura sp. NBRC 104412]|uniref:hypothetical protein n=1 Tax=Actinomadura sp. NBRC 104412 TaxID=3032203 RepID=UPI0024A0D468|nr:hypothetical protein [Actinomadura sp. NBRC 104412]GLZ02845.1 hypothetical protein Acsp03_03120 [Actinomadura sp. NBRC 104412]
MQFDRFESAAREMGNHPQDHGWRDFYRLVGYGLAAPSAELRRILALCHGSQPAHSATHLISLVGIAIKTVRPDALPLIYRAPSMKERLRLLEETVGEHGDDIRRLVSMRRNSFTGARRFLVPQAILSAFFRGHEGDGITFADFGTGLGILPRQLNCETLYRTFAPDLVWDDGIPRFRPIPLRSSLGVDRGPMPDLEWVRSCYGPSDYYDELFSELTFTLDVLADEGGPVRFHEVDLVDDEALTAFLRDNAVHAGNLSYVLYEISMAMRAKLVRTLREGLRPPGLLIVTEPHGELTRQGCDVLVYCRDRQDPYRVCAVSDGHFKGKVTRLEHYREFFDRHPVTFD